MLRMFIYYIKLHKSISRVFSYNLFYEVQSKEGYIHMSYYGIDVLLVELYDSVSKVQR